MDQAAEIETLRSEVRTLRERLSRSDDDCQIAVGMIGDIVAQFVSAGRSMMALPPAMAVAELFREIEQASRPSGAGLAVIATAADLLPIATPVSGKTETTRAYGQEEADEVFVIRDAGGREVCWLPEAMAGQGPRRVDVGERLGRIIVDAINRSHAPETTRAHDAWLASMMTLPMAVVRPAASPTRIAVDVGLFDSDGRAELIPAAQWRWVDATEPVAPRAVLILDPDFTLPAASIHSHASIGRTVISGPTAVAEYLSARQAFAAKGKADPAKP